MYNNYKLNGIKTYVEKYNIPDSDVQNEHNRRRMKNKIIEKIRKITAFSNLNCAGETREHTSVKKPLCCDIPSQKSLYFNTLRQAARRGASRFVALAHRYCIDRQTYPSLLVSHLFESLMWFVVQSITSYVQTYVRTYRRGKPVRMDG